MLNSLQPGGRAEDREEIEQVRTLLFGEIQQQNERRFAAIESQLRDFRSSLEQQISAVAAHGASSQANLIRALGSAIAELGNQIQRLADGSGQGARSDE
jgi:hypothetical protein